MYVLPLPLVPAVRLLEDEEDSAPVAPEADSLLEPGALDAELRDDPAELPVLIEAFVRMYEALADAPELDEEPLVPVAPASPFATQPVIFI